MTRIATTALLALAAGAPATVFGGEGPAPAARPDEPPPGLPPPCAAGVADPFAMLREAAPSPGLPLRTSMTQLMAGLAALEAPQPR